MDDKTSSNLQPSITFGDSFTPTKHSLNRPLVSSPPTYSSTPLHNNPNFLPSINRLVNMENKDVFDARTTLLSPPEQTPQDSFTTRKSSARSMDFIMTGTHAMPMIRGQPPLSPPISPETKLINPESPPSINVRDPILFPQQDSSSQPPLFTSDPHRVVDEHVAARELSSFREFSPPRRVEYELALEFKSQIAEAYNRDRKRWARREFAQLKEDNMLKHGGKRYHAIAPASSGGVRGGVRVVKPSGPRTTGVVKPPRVKPTVPRGATPESGKRVAREDKDFNSLPDYCPPSTSLPNKPNSLKVDWKGAPIDLKFDPHAHLLHADEIALAANLRLDCATYLTSKRRIFIKRIEAYQIGKEFRKTDAQQACKIDVNKASKLWAAFDKVGWLHPKWIQQHIK